MRVIGREDLHSEGEIIRLGLIFCFGGSGR